MSRLKQPALFGFLLAALITLPLAESVFQVPIQVSDSLEAIGIAAKYSSASQLLSDSLRFSTTTLRPMRYLQTRWLLDAARRTNVTYNAVFRAAHVALLGLLVALFLLAVPVKNWTDLAAFSVALLVLLGIHTFVAMLQEAFPVNHYAEVGVCALAVFVIARQPPRWFSPILVCLLLACALSVIESGAMVWIVAVCCAAAGMRGMTRSSVMAATLVLGAYLLARYALEISSPGIGGHGSGFGATFYSPEDLKQRFAAHPLPFYAYNIGGALLSILFSEPRNGVYSLAIARYAGVAHPVVIINVLSSSMITAVIVWYAATRIGRARCLVRQRARFPCLVHGHHRQCHVERRIHEGRDHQRWRPLLRGRCVHRRPCAARHDAALDPDGRGVDCRAPGDKRRLVGVPHSRDALCAAVRRLQDAQRLGRGVASG